MSKPNRKGFEDHVLGYMGALTKGGGNRRIYESLFGSMNDKQFDAFVDKVEKLGSLSVWASNYDPQEMIQYETLLKLSEKYGVSIEQQLIIYDDDTGIKGLTAHKVVVGMAECRKQRQMLVKKISVAANDSSIDDLTGQVMGKSRATGISQPEITVLRNLGLRTMANELYNVKGGDLEALAAYKNDQLTTGKTNTNSSLRAGTIPKVLRSAYFLMRARGIDNNIGSRYG